MEKNLREGWLTSAFQQSRERMQQFSPEEISQRTLLNYDRSRNCFSVNSFGHNIEIFYPGGEMSLINSEQKTISIYWELILLNYLSHAVDIPLQKQWVSYRELEHGNLYYPNIRNHVLERLGSFFSECDKDLLKDLLNRLGFAIVDTKADLAARGEFVPRIPVLIQFWDGEEGISSTCQILFDITTSEQMHIEDTGALCRLVKDLIIKGYASRASK
ncbi:MAG: DUF3786 domain-containing protein [Bacillota bacterium]